MSVDTGRHVAPSGRTTVSEYAAAHVAGRDLADGTRERYARIVRLHVDGTALGRLSLAQVKPSHVAAWQSQVCKQMGTGSARNVVVLVRSVFSWAVDDQLIGRSPFTHRLPPPRRAEPVARTLTAEQLQRLLDATPDRYRGLVWAQAGLGLRISEAVALQVSDVDFLRRRVTVRHQVTESGQLVARLKAREVGQARVVDLPDVVGQALAEQLRAFPTDTGYVFSNAQGRPVKADSYRARTFGPAVARAGLEEGLRPHDLRHTFGSVLIADGWSAVEVAEAMGNTAALVLSVYAHVLEDRRRSAARTIDAAYGVTPRVTGLRSAR